MLNLVEQGACPVFKPPYGRGKAEKIRSCKAMAGLWRIERAQNILDIDLVRDDMGAAALDQCWMRAMPRQIDGDVVGAVGGTDNGNLLAGKCGTADIGAGMHLRPGKDIRTGKARRPHSSPTSTTGTTDADSAAPVTVAATPSRAMTSGSNAWLAVIEKPARLAQQSMRKASRRRRPA